MSDEKVKAIDLVGGCLLSAADFMFLAQRVITQVHPDSIMATKTIEDIKNMFQIRQDHVLSFQDKEQRWIEIGASIQRIGKTLSEIGGLVQIIQIAKDKIEGGAPIEIEREVADLLDRIVKDPRIN